MKTVDEKARELTPLNEIAARKLKELREVDEYKGSNDSKDAITVMKEAMLEYANQQPETEPMFKTSKDITEHEKWKQPKQGEVDALQYNEMVQFLRKWKVDSNAIADLRGLIKSTLTQDKVREAAEKAFNQARKQTSMLGEKDVQMTDYLISPKYKTFEDYWNSKKH